MFNKPTPNGYQTNIRARARLRSVQYSTEQYSLGFFTSVKKPPLRQGYVALILERGGYVKTL